MSDHKCPGCAAAGSSRVIDSRPTREGGTRRRRVCSACKHRWSTIEVPLGEAPIDLERLHAKLQKLVSAMLELLAEIEALTIAEKHNNNV